MGFLGGMERAGCPSCGGPLAAAEGGGGVYAVRPRGGKRGGRGAGVARLRRATARAHPRGTPQAREQDRDRRKGGARPPVALAGFYRDALHGREMRLELEPSRHEVYEGEIRRILDI